MPRYKVRVSKRVRVIYVVEAENKEKAEEKAWTNLIHNRPGDEEYADELFDFNHGYDDDLEVEKVEEI